MMTIDRRGLLLGAGALALSGAARGAAPSYIPETMTLPLPSGRTTTLSIWRPARAKGVILFSHGHGSWPARYERILARWRDDGYAVVAPMHVDSMHYADRDKFTMKQSFGERLSDMGAASAFAGKGFAGVPMGAAGHSFGSLIAMCLGGALESLMPLRNPAVTAVVAFSSAGKVPGLIRPDSYAGLAVPTLLITGDMDVVPGFVTDPKDHLFPIESAPAGGKYALVVKGGDHGLVAGGTGYDPGEALSRLFLDAYLPPDSAARARLAAFKPPAGDRFIVRGV